MHPILFEIAGIKLHSYGFFLVIGFFLSTWLACLEAKRRGYDPNIILDAAMPLLLVSILCCRILYFIIYPDQWRGFGEFFRIWNGGLSVHGGFVGVVTTLGYFSWKRKIKFGTLCDIIAPGMFLGNAIGRIGCLMNGCCYGYVCNLPWAIRFPDEHNRNILTPPSHPAQLYSTLMCLAIFAFMWNIRDKAKYNRFSGQLMLITVAFYACERFTMEIFRNGATAPMAFGSSWLTQAQFASIVALIGVGITYFVLSKRAANPPRPLDHTNIEPPAIDSRKSNVSAG